jgi:transglutaminase-like putative cysteine protease
MQQTEKYLHPTPSIDCDNESIKQKAEELTLGQERDADKAKSLFYFVRDEVTYSPIPVDFLEGYRASKTLEQREGFCVQKASLLAALARAISIPARLHCADIRNHLVSERLLETMGTNLFSYHGYSELYIGGKWVKATPAFDIGMCQENRIVPVDFDGQNDAIFHSHNLDGELHIEYVHDHGHFVDIPYDDMFAAWKRIYGLESRELLDQFIEKEKW